MCNEAPRKGRKPYEEIMLEIFKLDESTRSNDLRNSTNFKHSKQKENHVTTPHKELKISEKES